MIGRLLSVVVASAVLVLGGCSGARHPWPDRPVKVVVSFPPLYSFVEAIGGDRVEPAAAEGEKPKTTPGRVGVVSLTTTTGPHDYSYAPLDAIKLREADVVFSLGLGFDDSFVDRGVINSGNEKLKGNVVKLGNALLAHAKQKDQVKTLILFGECNHENHKGDKHAHEHDIDPHVWSGIAQAKILVGMIRDKLKEIDPNGAELYDANTTEYVAKLDALQAEGRKQLAGRTDRKLVTFHASMAYFAASFDLQIVESIRQIPGTNPNSVEFKELVQECQNHAVRVIAVEPQYPKDGVVHKLVTALQDAYKKTGIDKPAVKVIELDPLETAKPAELSATWYIDAMRKNLKALEGKEAP